MRRRLLVSAGRTDEHKLPRASAEQREIALHICRRERDEINDRIKRRAGQLLDQRRIIHIRDQRLHPGRQLRRMLPPREQRNVHAPLRRQCSAGRADDPRPANEQNLHNPLFVAGNCSAGAPPAIARVPCPRDPKQWRDGRPHPLGSPPAAPGLGPVRRSRAPPAPVLAQTSDATLPAPPRLRRTSRSKVRRKCQGSSQSAVHRRAAILRGDGRPPPPCPR